MKQILWLIVLVVMFTVFGFLAGYSLGHHRGWIDRRCDVIDSGSLNEVDKPAEIDFKKAVEDSRCKATPIHIKTPEERKRFERSDYKIRNAPSIAEARDDYRKYGKRIKQ